jgi:hypothetical protein
MKRNDELKVEGTSTFGLFQNINRHLFRERQEDSKQTLAQPAPSPIIIPGACHDTKQ